MNPEALPVQPAPDAASARAEARFHGLANALQDGVLEVDARWRTTFVNPSLAHRFDRPPSELLGRHFLEFVAAADRTSALTHMRRCEAGQPTATELHLRRGESASVWTRLRAQPLADERGRFLGVLTVLADLTDPPPGQEQHARLVEELRAAHARAQALSQELVRAREAQSARMAREIHDELGQALTGLKLDAAWLERRLARPLDPAAVAAMQARLKTMGEAIDATVLTTRRICTELRPGVLDDLGLVAAIEWQAREFEKRAQVAVELSLPDRPLHPSPACATSVFRIFQEILTNVARHAHARSVRVRLEPRPGLLHLEVHDDGRGFVETDLAESRALGLLGMKERAALCGGTLGIRSLPGQGTTVTLQAPAHPDPAAAAPTGAA